MGIGKDESPSQSGNNKMELVDGDFKGVKRRKRVAECSEIDKGMWGSFCI